jgi:heme-degrading monooxygenase HmoA
MIIRVYRCTVVAGKEAEHREFAIKKSHPSLSREEGLFRFYAGKPLPGSDDRTRCMVQIWESLEALKAARGENWDQPMKSLPDEVRGIYDSATVEHFELADEYSASED